MMYSYKGKYPVSKMPHRITLSNGFTRTDSSTFTTDEIQDAGWTIVSDPPSYNEETQHLNWNSKTVSWEIVDKTEEELEQERQKRFQLLLDDAKWVTRNKLKALINPLTGQPLSIQTDQYLIERDLQHESINMTMLLQQESLDSNLRAAILSVQSQAIAILMASKQVYAALEADNDYDFENSPLWP